MSDNQANIEAILADPAVSAAMDDHFRYIYKYVQDKKHDPADAEQTKAEKEQALIRVILCKAAADGMPVAQASRVMPGDAAAGQVTIHVVPDSYLARLPEPAAAGGSSGVARVDLTEESD